MRQVLHWIVVPAIFGFLILAAIVVGTIHHNLALTVPFSVLCAVAASVMVVVSTHRDIDRRMRP